MQNFYRRTIILILAIGGGFFLDLNAEDTMDNSIEAEIKYLQHLTSKRLNNRQASDVERRIIALKESIAEKATTYSITGEEQELFMREIDNIEASIQGALSVARVKPGSKRQRGAIGGVRELDISCRREVPIGDRSHCQ